jgi:hypothetical protein
MLLMATPFFDLTRQLNAEGFSLTYGEVLQVRDWYCGYPVNPHMRAARNNAYGLGIVLRILAVLHVETKRREEVEKRNGATAIS